MAELEKETATCGKCDNAALKQANQEREEAMVDAFNSEAVIVSSQLSELEKERDGAREAARIASATVVQVVNERMEATARGDDAWIQLNKADLTITRLEKKLKILKEEVSSVVDDMVGTSVSTKDIRVGWVHRLAEAVGPMPVTPEPVLVPAPPLPELDCECTACTYLRKKQREKP